MGIVGAVLMVTGLVLESDWSPFLFGAGGGALLAVAQSWWKNR